MRLRNAIVLSLGIITAPVLADPLFPQLENKPVLDKANVIDDADEAELNQTLMNFYKSQHRQLAVVTVPSLGDYDIETYANKYFRFLGLGDRTNNDGVLLLVAPTERKVRIEVGYGLESALTDADASYIIQNTMLPAFKAKKMSEGIVAGTAKILPEITAEAMEVLKDEQRKQAEQRRKSEAAWEVFMSWIAIILSGIAGLFGLGWIYRIPARRRAKQKANYTEMLATLPGGFSFVMAMTDSERQKQYGVSFDMNVVRQTALLEDRTGKVLQLIPDPTEQEQLIAVSRNVEIIKLISNPTDTVLQTVFSRDPVKAYQLFPNASSDLIEIGIRSDPLFIVHLPNITAKQRKLALDANPSAIRLLKNHTTPEIDSVLARDPSLLSAVIASASDEQILTAIMRHPKNIHLISSPTAEQQMAAVKADASVITFIKNPTDEVQAYAISKNDELSLVINNPSDATSAIRKNVEARKRREEAERARIREEQRQREEKERRAREAKRKKDEEEAAERRRRDSSSSYGGSSYGGSSYGGSSYGGSSYGGSSYGGDSGSSSSFSGEGGDGGGGGSTGSWGD